MQMLKARLYNYELEKREKESTGEKDQKKDIGWGHQIRSYVLHPYRLVKDNRTNFETSDPDKILNGDLDGFLESFSNKLDPYSRNYPLAVLGGLRPPRPPLLRGVHLEERTVAGTPHCGARDPPRQAYGLRMAYGVPYSNVPSHLPFLLISFFTFLFLSIYQGYT